MKIVSEEQILNKEFRVKVITEIRANENITRKHQALKRHEIYKDRTRKWVIESLTKELSLETIAKMENRASNVSIARKIVDKLAQSYNGGVKRTLDDDISQGAVDSLTKELDFNTKMKKADRYSQLHKNCLVQVVPLMVTENSKKLAKVNMKVFAPHQYDVLEDMADHTKAKVVVLNEFVDRNRRVLPEIIDGQDRRHALTPNFHQGNRKDETIADSPDDAGSNKMEFIWWSDSFHFTTDEKGEVINAISPEGLLNPIQTLPFVVIAEDQDGEFYALGGDDLVDGSILINVLLTDLYGIANVQGWGQMVITGKNIPKVIRGGPHNAIIIDYDDGDPVPSVDYKSSSPPLEAWMRMIEQAVALILSTNNLSPKNVSVKLDSTNMASGIAMLIQQSESTADIEEKQKIFQDQEPLIWEIVRRWQNLLFEQDALTEDFMEIGKFEDSNVSLEFHRLKPVITEKERIENIKIRKELGINTMVDLIMLDNPDLTLNEAEEKLEKVTNEKRERQKSMMGNMIANQSNNQEDTNQEAPNTPELNTNSKESVIDANTRQ